jgi:tetratricopeptide (TPR) repeat protein
MCGRPSRRPCRSDSFSSSSATAAAAPSVPSGKTSKSEAVSQLLAHVKLLPRRRAAAMAALDAGLPAEAVRHFTKILEARHGVLPHPFAAACLVGRAAAFQAGGRPADAIADCNRSLALDPAYIPALRAHADLLQSVGAVADCLRDLDHLKLLYDATLRDGKLPGPRWWPQGGVRYCEIAGAYRKLTARIQGLRGRVAAGEACNIDYYLLLGVRRGCPRSELERAHLLLSLKLKPDRAVVFGERLELMDEHRDLEAVRDQACMSALLLYRMLQKGYSFIMSAVLDEEAAERQRAKDAAAAAAALAAKQEAATQEPPQPMPGKSKNTESGRPRSPPGRGAPSRRSARRGKLDRPGRAALGERSARRCCKKRNAVKTRITRLNLTQILQFRSSTNYNTIFSIALFGIPIFRSPVFGISRFQKAHQRPRVM